MSTSSVSKPSHWATADTGASFDLRSDTMTRPTVSMREAVVCATFGDDICQEDSTTTALEKRMAELTGKEAALFVLSGTMGNQLGLRALLTQPPFAVLCDENAHIVNHEAGSIAATAGALPVSVKPANGHHLTLDDVKRKVSLSTDIHTCPTRVISLENTINGMIHPLEDIKKISEFARANNIKMHLDGARLWEAAVSTKIDIKEWCSHFDTITMCFSKGLGAPIGSILVGTSQAIAHARWTRKQNGGGVRQPGIITAPCHVAIDETFGTGGTGIDGKLISTHKMAQKVSELWLKLGGEMVFPTETNMVWPNVEKVGWTSEEFVKEMAKEGLQVFGPRIVCHYQAVDKQDEVLDRCSRVFSRVMEGRKDADHVQPRSGGIYGK